MSVKPVLTLDGVELPMPPEGGISVSFETIWSNNAGRSTAKSKFAVKDDNEDELVERNKNDTSVPIIIY